MVLTLRFTSTETEFLQLQGCSALTWPGTGPWSSQREMYMLLLDSPRRPLTL